MRNVVVLLLFSRALLGCSCRPSGPICARIDQIPITFVGVPVETNAGDPLRKDPSNPIWYRFAVEEPFRGVPDGTKEVIVDPASGSSCQMGFELGEKYLIVANRRPKTAETVDLLPEGMQLITGGCRGNRRVAYAVDDIEYLRQLAKAPQPASIFGLVQLHGDEQFRHSSYPPVPAARVRIVGVGIDRSVQTDSNGAYSFRDVLPGEYTLTARAPDLRSHLESYSLRVPPHGCGSANIALFASGVLAGRVIDEAGKPVTGVKVLYLAADDLTPQPDYFRSRTTTDGNGQFSFDQVAPGTYQIGVQIDGPPLPNKSVSATYWPGVTTHAEAGTVHLALNEARSNLTIPIRHVLTRRLQVRVIWPDGHAAEGVAVNATAEDKDYAYQTTGDDGVAELELLSDRGYMIEAHIVPKAENEGTSAEFSSKPIPVPKGDNRIEVNLVLSEQHVLATTY